MTVLTREGAPARSSGHRRIVDLRLRASRLLHGHLLWCVLGAYLLCRVFSFVLISWIASTQNPAYVPFGTGGGQASYWDMVRMWDGRWYEVIARQGYPSSLPHTADGSVAENPWAFYPLYPFLTRGLMVVSGGSFAVVGSLLSLVLAGGAVVLMAVLLRPRIGAGAAFAVTLAFSASPASPVLQMTYTESLGLLLLMGFLILISRRSWLGASALAILCGLSRPIAVPLGLVALVAVVVRWRRRHDEPIGRPEWIKMAVSLVSCAVSGLLWPVIAWVATGVPRAYTATEVAWRYDDHVVPFVPWVRNFDLLFGPFWSKVWLAVIVVGLLVMMFGPWAQALGHELRAWTLGYALYLGAVLDPWTSIYRFLLFAFPLLVVMLGAGHLKRDKPTLMWLRTICCTALFLGWQVWWAWTLLRLAKPVGNPI